MREDDNNKMMQVMSDDELDAVSGGDVVTRNGLQAIGNQLRCSYCGETFFSTEEFTRHISGHALNRR